MTINEFEQLISGYTEDQLRDAIERESFDDTDIKGRIEAIEGKLSQGNEAVKDSQKTEQEVFEEYLSESINIIRKKD